MDNIILDENTRLVDYHNSWAWEILILPNKERNKAMRIIDSWIDDELWHFFKNSGASSFVKATWIYLLEHLPVPELSDKNNPLNDDNPYIESTDDAVYYYVNFIDEIYDDEEIGKAFLQLMLDGYLKPNISKLIYEAKSNHPVKSINVSLRCNDSEEDKAVYKKYSNIYELYQINNQFVNNIEHLKDVIEEYNQLSDNYRDVYQLASSNLAFKMSYSDEEVKHLLNLKHLEEDEDLKDVRKEINYMVSPDPNNVKDFHHAIRFCKDNNLIFPYEEKIIANGTLEEKRLLALECIVRMKLYR